MNSTETTILQNFILKRRTLSTGKNEDKPVIKCGEISWDISVHASSLKLMYLQLQAKTNHRSLVRMQTDLQNSCLRSIMSNSFTKTTGGQESEHKVNTEVLK